jgi:hypothetical protein
MSSKYFWLPFKSVLTSFNFFTFSNFIKQTSNLRLTLEYIGNGNSCGQAQISKSEMIGEKLGMVVNDCNPTTWEVDRRIKSLRPL